MPYIAGFIIAALCLWALFYVATSGRRGKASSQESEIRRIDLGVNNFAAQSAESILSDKGLSCRLVSMEQGAFGIGNPPKWYLVYEAQDEPEVVAVLQDLLQDDPEALRALPKLGPN